jgi:hypothetical protein
VELAAKDPLLPTDRTHDRLGLATGAASAVPVRCDVTIHAAAGLPQPNGVPPLRLETVTIENVAMQIQTYTDRNIAGHEALAQTVEEIVQRLLGRFSEQISRVEVHLSDENSSAKSGIADKRCLLEAKLAGQQPVSVSEQAQTVESAVKGAAHKMVHLLDSELGKLRQH